MATRTKTIEYATSVDIASVATTVYTATKTVAIYIPETIVAFRSVTAQVMVRDATTAGATMSVPEISISDDNTNWNAKISNNPIANSGEGQTYCFRQDVTAEFQTGVANVGPYTPAGGVQTWYLRFRCTGPATRNHSFKLFITYEYDDTATTHVKTVRIPIESTRQVLTNAFQTVGGATAIPAIKGSYFPEASVNVRQAFVEVFGNESPATGTTDSTMSLRIGGGTQRDVWYSAQVTITGNGCPIWLTYDCTSENAFTTAVAFEMLNSVTTRVGRPGAMLVVTYEFNATTSTTIYNSLLLGAIDTSGAVPGTTVADVDSWSRSIFIEEPGTITLKESAACLFFQTAAPGSGTISVACGAQSSYTGHNFPANSSFELGPYSLVHRIDGGGQNGVAFATLARGRNAYELRFYASAASVWWNPGGFMILNYTSSKATAGVGVHAQSRFWLLAPNNAAASQARKVTTTSTPTIVETDYWLVGAFTDFVYEFNATAGAWSVCAERAAGEGEGEGWETIAGGQATLDAEKQTAVRLYSAARRAWKRHPRDIDTDRMNIETAREWTVWANPTTYWNLGIWTTWHNHTWTVAGTVSGSSGGTVYLDLCRVNGDEVLDRTTRSGNGAYSFTWYDNTESVYVRAWESNALTASSGQDVAT